MKKYRVLKLVGLAILTMVTLVTISVIEVAVYSYLVNPGQDPAVYDDHAMASAPWISAIFGFIVFFLVVRYWGKKKYPGLMQLALLFAFTYIALDLVIVMAMGVSWAEFYLIFLLANGAKLAGALVAYFVYRPRTEAI